MKIILCSLATFSLIMLALSIPAFCGEIHAAAKSGDLAKVNALLKDDPKLISSMDNKGETPLHAAASNDRKDVAQLLLENGGDANAKDINGCTPLHKASEAGHNSIVELLLAKGADVNAKTSTGMTPLDIAVFNSFDDAAELLRRRGGNAGIKLYMPGNGVKSPEILAKAHPRLEKARKAYIFDGEIFLQAIVHKDGTVDSIKVIKGLDYGIDEEVVNTISSKWRFKPGTLNGDPVDVIIDIKFSFHMD
jgi:ankyrin repeat protein